MARRELQEINAGSMADIAFLLLIFWLVTTTIDADMGLRRELPAWEEPGTEVKKMEIDKQNTFEITINRNNELKVEGKRFVSVKEANIREKVKDFFIGAGDGLTEHEVGLRTVGTIRSWEKGPTGSPYPNRTWLNQQDEEKVIEELSPVISKLEEELERAIQNDDPDVEAIQNRLNEATKVHRKSQLRLDALEAFGGAGKGNYRLLDETALVSVQVDNATSYKTYIDVQDEVMSALNELRNELALDRFNISYSELEAIYEDNKDDSETLKRINSCNVVYPERVTELKAIDSEADNQSLE